MATMESTPGLQMEANYKTIVTLAVPISLAIFIPQLNFIINTIFLGHYDSQSMAVAGITGVYYLIFGAIGFGLNNGLQALIARRAGENRPEEIGKIFNQGILFGLAIAVVGITCTYTVVPGIFAHFITDPERLKQAIDFLYIRIWGLPFLYIYQMRNALLVGTNQSRYLVIGTLAEALCNIFFDYTLIFGRLGFPELGFNGSAYASILAEFTGMFVVYLVIYQKGISQRFQLFQKFRLDPVNLRLIFNMSGPLIFQHAFSIISWEYFFLEIDGHGEKALAISNAMRNIFGFFGCVTWALAATSNAMVSNVIGQQKSGQVWMLIGKISRLSLGFAVGVALLLNLFPEALLAIYGQPPGFISEAIPVIRVVSVATIMMSFSTVLLNAVTGTGNSKVTFLIESGAIVLYCVYVYLVLDYWYLPITYGWMSEWLYWSSIFSACYLYLRSGKWKNKILE